MSFKRQVLSALGKDALLDIGRRLELDVTTRMGVDELRDALARSKRASLPLIVHDALPRDTLREICRAAGLEEGGKEKSVLIERILAAGTSGRKGSTDYRVDVTEGRGDLARDAGFAGFVITNPPAPSLSGMLGDSPAGARAKPKKKSDKGGRRRAGVPESEAVIAGTLKAALQQFALAAAGGYSGRDAGLSFTTHLLECFGWSGGRPDGADLAKPLSIADGGRRVDRSVSLWWPERRTLMDVVAHETSLESAWKDLVRVCLQLTPVPQYVVLTNQRDLQLYDLARDREAPRLAIRIDDLPKYSEAFPFFTQDWVPGATPRIVNVEKVSGEVADLVARLYRSVRDQHPKRERDVIRFTLQCITAMFAEDIGLLPKNYFTTLLYDGAKSDTVEQRLNELFTQMNTPALPAPRVVPYFNGGLFTEAATLPLGPEQVMALTKAAEANWTFVDPHIFGSVFQGIMDDAERHASGAHYTAHDDIMRVVGPTIVEPWRKRIQAAKSLKELTELRKELFAFRVLDPACGSGNFLYVAFRELYRLDTELLSRMREFPSTAGKLSWNGGISAVNFYGIDINPFAVELAKVTLNIAKKIAFEERKAQAFALAGQVEMDIDPSLPLDNLDQNIVCADALFRDWPEVDAIVGNPPMLGDRKIRSELGAPYLSRLQATTGISGVVDLCCYWFRRSHDRLLTGGRAGLVGTSGIRIGKAREASLDYIAGLGGTLVNAVSSRPWPGDAALDVSMVSWIKGEAEGPFQLVVDDHVYHVARIPTHLQLHADVAEAKPIKANEVGSTMGIVIGHEAFRSSGGLGFPLEAVKGKPFVHPLATGDEMLRGLLSTAPEYLVDLAFDTEEEAARVGGAAFQHLKRHVYPQTKERATNVNRSQDYARWFQTWWQPLGPRRAFRAAVAALPRMIACTRVQERPIFEFISTAFVPTDTLQVFGFDDDYSFGVIQSSHHWSWAKANGGKVTARPRYTSDVWKKFPWPQEPSLDTVLNVAQAARDLRRVRRELMAGNGWSLRALYQAADVDGPHPLKEAQAALDVAVSEAYGMPSHQTPNEFLLELNQLVVEDEEHGRTVQGPGVPRGFDPRDPRLVSTDCIEPPPVEN